MLVGRAQHRRFLFNLIGSPEMTKGMTLTFLPLSIVALREAALAQSPTGGGAGFEKKEFTYEDFAKGHFSDVVTVTAPGKLIFLSGTGACDAVSPIQVAAAA